MASIIIWKSRIRREEESPFDTDFVSGKLLPKACARSTVTKASLTALMENHWQRVTMAIDISSVVIVVDVDVEMLHLPSLLRRWIAYRQLFARFSRLVPLCVWFVASISRYFPLRYQGASSVCVCFFLQTPESITSRSRMNVNVCLNDWTSQITLFPSTPMGIMASSRFVWAQIFGAFLLLLCITMATELSIEKRTAQREFLMTGWVLRVEGGSTIVVTSPWFDDQGVSSRTLNEIKHRGWVMPFQRVNEEEQ